MTETTEEPILEAIPPPETPPESIPSVVEESITKEGKVETVAITGAMSILEQFMRTATMQEKRSLTDRIFGSNDLPDVQDRQINASTTIGMLMAGQSLENWGNMEEGPIKSGLTQMVLMRLMDTVPAITPAKTEDIVNKHEAKTQGRFKFYFTLILGAVSTIIGLYMAISMGLI